MTIEEQLVALPSGQFVSLIRHFFGNQSDSMIGQIMFYRTHELMVNLTVLDGNFNSSGIAIIFGVSDIKSIEKLKTDGGIDIIRLKSPSDYFYRK